MAASLPKYYRYKMWLVLLIAFDQLSEVIVALKSPKFGD